jgi:Fe-S cluster assembly protein SufD
MLSIPAGSCIAEPIELAAYGAQVSVTIGEYAQVVLRDTLQATSACVERVIVLGAHSCVQYQLSLASERAHGSGHHDERKISIRVRVVLAARGASFEGFIRLYCVPGSDLAVELLQEHAAPYTSSLFEVRQVLCPGAQSAVRGMLEVWHLAQHAQAEQQMRSIVLEPESGHAEHLCAQHKTACVRMCPELRVVNNTARVKHGAALGQLDCEQLAYLQSRGVPEQRAQELLIAGFLSCA